MCFIEYGVDLLGTTWSHSGSLGLLERVMGEMLEEGLPESATCVSLTGFVGGCWEVGLIEGVWSRGVGSPSRIAFLAMGMERGLSLICVQLMRLSLFWALGREEQVV